MSLALPGRIGRTCRIVRSWTGPECSRSYHSYEHEAPSPFPPAESAILSAALLHVPTHGFTTTALARGAQDAGYLSASTNLFPKGAFDLVNYHLITQRLALKNYIPSDSTLRHTMKVKALALHRLYANKPIIHRWQEVHTRRLFFYYVPLTRFVGSGSYGFPIQYALLNRRARAPFRRDLVPRW